MFIYTYLTKLSSQPDFRSHSTHRANFAREAALDAFGPRAVAVQYEPGFKDRRPYEPPRLSPVSWRRETNGPKRVELADLIGPEAAR